jgi:hypothetical protein
VLPLVVLLLLIPSNPALIKRMRVSTSQGLYRLMTDAEEAQKSRAALDLWPFAQALS